MHFYCLVTVQENYIRFLYGDAVTGRETGMNVNANMMYCCYVITPLFTFVNYHRPGRT